MTESEIQEHKNKIDKMSHEEMARLYRYAPAGHMYFVNGSSISEYFRERFQSLGGMTTEISKKIG